jgi:hypothetical protein
MTLKTTEGIASLITRLRKEETNCDSVYIVDAAIETIERLVKERDAARRLVCLGFSKPGWLPKQTGHSMGWDYLFEAGAK